MRTRLSAAFLILACASVVHAVVVGMEWRDTPLQTIQALPSADTTMRFYLANGSSVPSQAPKLSAVGLRIEAWQDAACTVPADGLLQVATVADLPGWSVHSANTNDEFNDHQFAVVSGPDTTIAQGKAYVMDITARWLGTPAISRYYLTVNRRDSVLIDYTGLDYMNTDYAWFPSGFETAGRSRWGFGNWGGGKWERYDSATSSYIGQAANPLILDIVPEPASVIMLLVGMGGLLARGVFQR